MCRIPHARRRNGRYVFRRRVHFRNIISKPIALALQTAGEITLSAKLTEQGEDISRGLVWRVFGQQAGPDGKPAAIPEPGIARRISWACSAPRPDDFMHVAVIAG